MRKLLMVRYGEIYLKGLNRPYFLKALVNRVKEAAKPFGGKVWLHDARVFVSDMNDFDACMERVRKVFGVHSVCPAIEMEKENFDAICEQADLMMKDVHGTFKVEARRADKRYFMDSPTINKKLGEYVLERNEDHLKVDVHHPEHILSVEIRDQAYLYCQVYMAVGGMPVGTGGKAALLLSGGIDSPVAGYMIAKRGVQLVSIHYHSFPYTSEFAKQKVLDLGKILSEYCCGMKVYVVPFTEIQMEIHEKCPEDYTTLIMRRYMMRIAERIAKKEGALALITGESVGQVASQTMEALNATNSVVSMPVFRPLIGFDKSDIMDYARKIGTYETSCLPYEDCCTVFTPKHPATKPKADKIKEGEDKLDQEALIEKAVENAEIVLL
ncbi:MAG: tRNA 4-thiouridine(8) synthase ThiI [Clostridiales bacterium]|nr:tRNA 4-thiouridine(8) synthase ThiI [Clostridiales bacterium]